MQKTRPKTAVKYFFVLLQKASWTHCETTCLLQRVEKPCLTVAAFKMPSSHCPLGGNVWPFYNRRIRSRIANIRPTSVFNHSVLSSKYHEILCFGWNIFIHPVDLCILQYQWFLREISSITAVNLSRSSALILQTFCSRGSSKLDLSFTCPSLKLPDKQKSFRDETFLWMFSRKNYHISQ